MQSSMMASSLYLHFPEGNDRFERPKSVLSKMTTLLLKRSCMCMAEMPMDLCKRVHSPPPVTGAAVWGEVVVVKGKIGNEICGWNLEVEAAEETTPTGEKVGLGSGRRRPWRR